MAMTTWEKSMSLYEWMGASGNWNQDFFPTGSTKARDFGTYVSLHDLVIVVGDSRYGDGERGVFYVYQFEGCSWIKMNGAFVNTGCDWKFGSHVELIDRYHMLVSCHRENGARNTMYYYTRTSLWTESMNTFTMKQDWRQVMQVHRVILGCILRRMGMLPSLAHRAHRMGRCMCLHWILLLRRMVLGSRRGVWASSCL